MTTSKTPKAEITLPDDVVADVIENVFTFKHKHEGRIHVVKASGKIIEDPAIRKSFAKQVTTMRRDLGLKVVVVHGAGKQIDTALEEAGMVSHKPNGLRISEASHIEIIDAATMRANAMLVDAFNDVAKGHVIPLGLPGHDTELKMKSAPIDTKNNNFSGETVLDFDKWYLRHLLDDGKTIPIITNMCINTESESGVAKINVNADAVATILATGMNAHRLLMCSDKPGVQDKNGNTIPELTPEEAKLLVQRGIIKDGMAVKVDEAFATASRMGADAAVIIMDHNFLVELLTPKGRGTMFRASALTQ